MTNPKERTEIFLLYFKSPNYTHNFLSLCSYDHLLKLLISAFSSYKCLVLMIVLSLISKFLKLSNKGFHMGFQDTLKQIGNSFRGWDYLSLINILLLKSMPTLSLSVSLRLPLWMPIINSLLPIKAKIGDPLWPCKVLILCLIYPWLKSTLETLRENIYFYI